MSPSLGGGAHANHGPGTLFPLIRHLSIRSTSVLAGLPVTANQITAASLALGLASGVCVMQGTYAWSLAGGVLLFLCYLLDNCDGEIARVKNQCSEFGRQFDNTADWLVHAWFFAALGIGVSRATGEGLWLWLGWIAAAGGTINHVLLVIANARVRRGGDRDPGDDRSAKPPSMPETWVQWTVFVFRELFRADFCFIVLILALFDLTWVLLPAAAVGTHLYWAAQFIHRAREFRV